MNKILVTGSAGFIGFHLTSKLLEQKYEVVGIDNLNEYYDVNLKYSRLKILGIDNVTTNNEFIYSKIYNNYKFIKLDISDFDSVVDLIVSEKFDCIINLAAQAGVRYSIENPRIYIKANIDGFLSVLEGCRQSNVKHLIYASTSSVYGLNSKMPLNENMPTEHPMALYAATKKSNELMAHSYSHLFNIPSTGLRFFTVYGPWGRPDMALFLFTKNILEKKPINIFNNGNMIRDFTFVDDIVESIIRLIPRPPEINLKWDSNNPEISSSSAPFQIFNIGNSSPVKLMKYINAVENILGIKSIKNFLPMQDGDVPATHADVLKLENYINFKPNTNIEDGVRMFIEWYKQYYVNND
jgi:UDP-glucuronate 4-epimerase